jgi:signal transduction histidine kinase
MKPSLRFRIVLTLVPFLVLVAGLGGAAVAVLQHLGSRIEVILSENYDSVLYMERLNEALERIDSSFQFALAGKEEKARDQYRANWPIYEENLHKEENNITLPGEKELVERLARLTQEYRAAGEVFYGRHATDRNRRQEDYFGRGGLLDHFKAIKEVATQIRQINQDNMVEGSREARHTAQQSIFWFSIGLAGAIALAGVNAWQTTRALLRPIQSATRSALAIGSGNLDQVVPVTSHDELGQLAEAFNLMARQLRHYRQTDYARLLRAQRTGQATIDSFPDPVFVVDSERHVEMANPAAQRLLGVSPRPADQSSIPWQPPAELEQPLENALKHKEPYLPDGFERLISLRGGGQLRSFLPRILPISDPYGNTLGAAVHLQDVTRFRLLDQIKSDLVATVSHELKTPLTSLRLAIHVLLEEAVGPLAPKQIELLVDARENAELLLSRVNNLLDLARLEQRRDLLDLHPEDPAALLQAAADAVRPQAADRGIDLVIDAPQHLPAVAADAGRLGHALGNLLDNALIYTDRGGQITLSASAMEDRVLLTVSDTGVGILPEHMPHVFERFFRVPEQSRGGGTGLGLAIVREIVEAHGGDIVCVSRAGKGTEFRITLPVWKDPAPSSDGAKAATAATTEF